MIKKGLLMAIYAFFIQLVIIPVFAVKAYPFPVTITQPDGTQLAVQLHGDENRHFRTTEDGYLIKRNVKGFYTYANLNAKGKSIESNIIARNKMHRTSDEIQFLKNLNNAETIQQIRKAPLENQLEPMQPYAPQKALPLNQSPKTLVILVNFADTAYITPNPQIAFTNLLNQEGYSANGGTGSAREYFMASSYGHLSPEFDVEGPFTLPNNMEFYGANNSSGNDINPVQMVVDACKAADATVDFSQYDSDNDGIIDNVFIYYAGHNEAEHGPENSVWPHRWYVKRNYNYSGSTASIKFDDKLLQGYACTSELRGASGSEMCGIGTFCHEMGHVIGLPDYYHTEAAKATLGNWSIMDIGVYLNKGRTPPLYSAFDRFYLGYLTPEQVSTSSDLTLFPIYQGKTQPANTENQAFLFAAENHNLIGDNPVSAEFFMVEYRKKTGWDTYLPDEGMLIWHIDFNSTDWDSNRPNNYSGTEQTPESHMRVYLQPLIGSTATPGKPFTTGSFIPTTWSGDNINRTISEITKSEDRINFKLMGGSLPVLNLPAVNVGVIENHLQFLPTRQNSSTIKTINIKTAGIIGDLTLTLSGENTSFYTTSATTITKEVANDNGGINFDITYTPALPGDHTAILTISGGGLNPEKVIIMTGTGY
jgi:M6 family metalloprotease-like protein